MTCSGMCSGNSTVTRSISIPAHDVTFFMAFTHTAHYLIDFTFSGHVGDIFSGLITAFWMQLVAFCVSIVALRNSISAWDLFTVGPTVARTTNTVFQFLSSSTVTVVSNTSVTLKCFVLKDNSSLYHLVARRSAAEVLISGRLIKTYC